MAVCSAVISDARTASEHLSGDTVEPLRSAVLAGLGEQMLGEAIARALAAPPQTRATLFEHLTRQIVAAVAASDEGRPWTCTVFRGTDGSSVFRGGVGHSIVIDLDGRVWRARSYEDFATTYTITENSCEINSLSPLYEQMHEYLPR